MPKKVTINFHDGPANGRYQIYPSEDLCKMIEKYRKAHPSRMTVSSALCTLLHERLTQIELAEQGGRK